MGTPEIEKLASAVVVLILVSCASIAIWKWGTRYKSSMANAATVLMIAGVWIGIGVPGGLIIFLAGLVVMLVARKKFIDSQRNLHSAAGHTKI